MTAEDVKQESLDFVKNPRRWPLFPVLPLKHADKSDKHGFPNLAVLIIQPNMENYLLFEDADLYDLSSLKDGKEITPEELIEEGWRID